MSVPAANLRELVLRGPLLTLSVAESLTCGRLQARIGSVSGASDFLLGGITAYSLDQKVRLLGVDRAEADATNCVSQRIAEQMARGACVLFGSDVGASTTGYAEPSPRWSVAEPFAWWSIAHRGPGGDFSVQSARVDCPGLGRVEVQERVAGAVYGALCAWFRERSAARSP